MAEYDADGWQQVLDHEPDRAAEDADSAASDGAPEPWYRNRVLLALWALMVALLLTLVIYGMVELSRGGGENSGPATQHVVHHTDAVVDLHHYAILTVDDPAVEHHRSAPARVATARNAGADTGRGAAAGERLPVPGPADADITTTCTCRTSPELRPL